MTGGLFISATNNYTQKQHHRGPTGGDNRFAFWTWTWWAGAKNNNGAYVLGGWAMRVNKVNRGTNLSSTLKPPFCRTNLGLDFYYFYIYINICAVTEAYGHFWVWETDVILFVVTFHSVKMQSLHLIVTHFEQRKGSQNQLSFLNFNLAEPPSS